MTKIFTVATAAGFVLLLLSALALGADHPMARDFWFLFVVNGATASVHAHLDHIEARVLAHLHRVYGVGK
jgi:hypothetical protein